MPGNQARSDWTDRATHVFDRFRVPPKSWITRGLLVLHTRLTAILGLMLVTYGIGLEVWVGMGLPVYLASVQAE